MVSRFRLAPMSAAIWVLTLVCLAIPPALAVAAVRAPRPVHGILIGVALVTLGLYALIGLAFRPTSFVIEPDALVLNWPLRTRRIERSCIVRARVCSFAELRAELGYVLRVGAGGLWGGFGRAKTARGMLELWVSRTDRIVYVECTGRRSLLITPAEPERFAAELGQA